ncbi:exosortase F system-associated protein [Flavobacterium sp.]|uniref:exosortase F system-associated membrane protein n=1 Tax=Flavobacterium sp. TaxID=239 RepID=UPI0022C1B414|nr:exosortase F system-associated protein [Flavobacterium sp.]MCZ8228107.1 exosortase F system-associated protein [Flavobacterium sp.]
MVKNLLQNKGKIVLGLLVIFLFALIREYETQLFYDPFLSFFKGDYANSPLPKYDSFCLFFGLLFRYGLNSLLSLALLYVLFKDLDMVQFSGILFVVFFVLLVVVLFCLLSFQNQNYLLLFYVRRFLIQPIFILLFIPGFYYQKMKSNK